MPHVILEIPRVLAEEHDLQLLLQHLHQAIMSIPSASLADIKTRIHLLDAFRIADGTPKAGMFIHARLIQTRSRSLEDQQLMAEKVVSTLQHFFSNDTREYPLQLCVETTIVPPGNYLKLII
ncbi:hypothetical protein [Legionella bozemanae]|uniref:hypothetical protein n=1 Tax=Legionella bozemanae TaxID=447 RepID=UPI00399C9D60